MKHLSYLLRYLMVLGIALGISFGAHIGVRDHLAEAATREAAE